MKMFEFAVPYSETVYGEVVYRVEAENIEEAKKLLQKGEHLHYYDQESSHSEQYTLYWHRVRMGRTIRLPPTLTRLSS
jgi:hypothetical protein